MNERSKRLDETIGWVEECIRQGKKFGEGGYLKLFIRSELATFVDASLAQMRAEGDERWMPKHYDTPAKDTVVEMMTCPACKGGKCSYSYGKNNTMVSRRVCSNCLGTGQVEKPQEPDDTRTDNLDFPMNAKPRGPQPKLEPGDLMWDKDIEEIVTLLEPKNLMGGAGWLLSRTNGGQYTLVTECLTIPTADQLAGEIVESADGKLNRVIAHEDAAGHIIMDDGALWQVGTKMTRAICEKFNIHILSWSQIKRKDMYDGKVPRLTEGE